jgi:diacylglycerol kinase
MGRSELPGLPPMEPMGSGEPAPRTHRPPGHASSLRRSFHYAAEGFWYALRTQRNLRIHISVGSAVLLLGYWLRLGRVEWAVIVLLIGLVLAAELINTVVEAVVDLVTVEYHPLAKIAKDVAAAAVLTVSVTSVVVGLCLLGPPLWRVLTAWLGGPE